MGADLLLRTVALASLLTLTDCSQENCECPDAGTSVEITANCDELTGASAPASCNLVVSPEIEAGFLDPSPWSITLNPHVEGTTSCPIMLTFASGATYTTVVQATRGNPQDCNCFATVSPSTIQASLTCPP
jgi:hypothetical protein